MSEQQCSTCRYWDDEGFCERVHVTWRGETQYQTKAKVLPYGPLPDEDDDEYAWQDLKAGGCGLKTEPDFYCSQWGAKDSDDD